MNKTPERSENEFIEINDPLIDNLPTDADSSKSQPGHNRFYKAIRRRGVTTLSMVIVFVVFVVAVMMIQFFSPSNSIQNDAKTFLSRYGRQDITSALTLIYPDSHQNNIDALNSLFDDEYAAEFYALAFEQYSFSVEYSSQHETDGECIVVMTLPNVSSVIDNFDFDDNEQYKSLDRSDFINSDFSDEIFKYLTENVKNSTMSFPEITMSISLKQHDGEWKVVLDDNLLDILTGNLFSSLGL